MNDGKKFEQDFKNSIPTEYFYYRFKDGTSSWDGGNARFQAKNICDCMVMTDEALMLMELKSTKAKSLPFSMIDRKNLDALVAASKHDRSPIKSLLVVNFRSVEMTFYMDAEIVQSFMDGAERKSIPIDYFKEYGTLIRQVKKRVRFRYFMFDKENNIE